MSPSQERAIGEPGEECLGGDKDKTLRGLPLSSPPSLPATLSVSSFTSQPALLSPTDMVPSVLLSSALTPDTCCEKEAALRRTVMHSGLATPMIVLDADCKAFFPAGCVSEAETVAGSATSCSSPERQSTTCSRSCSDQDQDFAVALGYEVHTSLAAGARPQGGLLQSDTFFTTDLLQPSAAPYTQAQHAARAAAWPSQGSTLHHLGTCHPCAWYWKPVGCQSAAECTFCHLCPDGVLKARKKAKQSMKRLGLATPKSGGLESPRQGRFALNLASLI